MEKTVIKVDDVTVVDGVITLLFKCTKCETKAEIKAFGIRKMQNGTKRRQSQCRKCRNKT